MLNICFMHRVRHGPPPGVAGPPRGHYGNAGARHAVALAGGERRETTVSTIKNLGLLGLDHVHFAVHDLERAAQLYQSRFGFVPRFTSTPAYTERTGHQTRVFQVGRNHVAVSQPVRPTSAAGRFLRVHPEGVMHVGFCVQDPGHAFSTLESRQGTPLADPLEKDGVTSFEMGTPLGDVLFRFVARKQGAAFDADMEPVAAPAAAATVAPWIEMDHLTSNARTMRPITDWYASVMGMTRFWDVAFHTTDTPEGARKDGGTGLKSIVMWDEHSGIKFATNEPLRPFFRQSQIERFVADNRGPGVQHIALSVPSIIEAVDALVKQGFEFLAAPATYYQRLADRMVKVGWDIKKVREPIAELQRRSILLDASQEGYMLQIFQKELRAVQGITGDTGCPAFFEVIQRAGDRGFGYGNFRALFEAIEATQATRAD